MIGYHIAIEEGVWPIYCTVISLRSGTLNIPNASSYYVCVLDEDTTPLGSSGRRLDILLRLIGILAGIVPTLPECDGAIITP